MFTAKEFRQAKNTIRAGLQSVTRERVEEILDAARQGKVPYMGYVEYEALVSGVPCGCLSQRIVGLTFEAWNANTLWDQGLDDAYFNLGSEYRDPQRQRILVAMCKAELRRRDREAVRELIESAEPYSEIV